VELQQPLTAEKFVTTPPAAAQVDGMHGFKYHVYNFSNVAADQLIQFQATYVKTDPNPSTSSIQVPETQPSTAGSTTPDTSVPADPMQVAAVAGLGGLLGVGLLGVLMWFRRRQPAAASSRNRARGADGASAGGYCGQCGSALKPQDRFCPNCGTKRKA
jgi:hypothetical protein